MRIAALFAATAISAAACAADDSAAARVVPFTRAGNLVFVDVRLNGSRTLACVVDTGAARTVVDAKVSRALQLREAEADTIGGAGAGRIPVRKIHDVELQIGEGKVGAYEFVAADLSGITSLVGRRVDAIIGYEFLSRFVVTIDYAKNQLLLRAPSADAPQDRGEELPLRIENGWAFVRATLHVDGQPAITDEFLLDSGSDDAVDHPIAARAADRVATQTGNGLGAPVNGFVARAAMLRLGSHELHDLPMSSGGGTEATSKLIGGAVLSRFTVTLDYPHARMFLARRDSR